MTNIYTIEDDIITLNYFENALYCKRCPFRRADECNNTMKAWCYYEDWWNLMSGELRC